MKFLRAMIRGMVPWEKAAELQLKWPSSAIVKPLRSKTRPTHRRRAASAKALAAGGSGFWRAGGRAGGSSEQIRAGCGAN